SSPSPQNHAAPHRCRKVTEYRQQEIARTLSYVHCWFTGDSTNNAMWKAYGDDGAGICIESSSFALLSSKSKPTTVDQLSCGAVTYSDGSQAIATDHSCAAFFHKNERYVSEQEIRIVAHLAHDPNTLRYDNASDRLAMPVALPVLVKRIVLGEHIDKDTAIEVTGLVAGFSNNAPIVRRRT
ncbi:MAG: DUF2971 domain-containing protein, partial [bacterium]